MLNPTSGKTLSGITVGNPNLHQPLQTEKHNQAKIEQL
jgi:hypothetical protein